MSKKMMTINGRQRALLTEWMVLNKPELSKLTNLVIAEKASEALGFKVGNYTVEHIRMHLFPVAREEKAKRTNNGGVLMGQIRELKDHIGNLAFGIHQLALALDEHMETGANQAHRCPITYARGEKLIRLREKIQKFTEEIK